MSVANKQHILLDDSQRRLRIYTAKKRHTHIAPYINETKHDLFFSDFQPFLFPPKSSLPFGRHPFGRREGTSATSPGPHSFNLCIMSMNVGEVGKGPIVGGHQFKHVVLLASWCLEGS